MASVLFEGFDLDSADLAKIEQNLPSNQRNRTPNKRSLKKKSKKYGPRDSMGRRLRMGKPGSRRYEQLMQEYVLWRMNRELADDHAAFQGDAMPSFADLYEEELYEPKYTPFSELFLDKEKMALFEEFLNITEEEQEEKIAALCGKQRPKLSDVFQIETNAGPSKPIELTPEQAFQRLDSETRKLLRKYGSSAMLEDIDDKVFGVQIGDSPNMNKVPAGVELDLAGEDYECFYFKDSFARRLAHGIAQYYCLNCYSCDTAAGRLTVVKKSKTGAYVPPELPLTVFLTRQGENRLVEG
eukprot:TRINITY_DN3036_c0_g1_i1.p1 TRINITY_DN3036_c0_g1~~TRINITY_DN3036_c0_g1_i1.p1  ORF type:complete len:297 (-),score=59.57 TRINITY_DN3036_c0_g1_i1:209-1099(-)